MNQMLDGCYAQPNEYFFEEDELDLLFKDLDDYCSNINEPLGLSIVSQDGYSMDSICNQSGLASAGDQPKTYSTTSEHFPPSTGLSKPFLLDPSLLDLGTFPNSATISFTSTTSAIANMHLQFTGTYPLSSLSHSLFDSSLSSDSREHDETLPQNPIQEQSKPKIGPLISTATPAPPAYPCPRSGKSLPKKYLLSSHMRLHTKLVPCPAPGCSHHTAKNRGMYRHIAAKHPNSDFLPANREPRTICPFPGRKYAQIGFARKDHLVRHPKRMHSGVHSIAD